MSLTDISKMPARVSVWCWDGIRWKSFLEKRKSRNFVIEAKEKENHLRQKSDLVYMIFILRESLLWKKS